MINLLIIITLIGMELPAAVPEFIPTSREGRDKPIALSAKNQNPPVPLDVSGLCFANRNLLKVFESKVRGFGLVPANYD